MFKCNCPHETRSGCSEPKCPHYDAGKDEWKWPESPTTMRDIIAAYFRNWGRREAYRAADDLAERLQLLPVSTLEVTRIKEAFPLYDERMIYDVAMQLVGIRSEMGAKNGEK